MGKGTMVCGDTLMFNHKWPPPMPVLTSPFHYSSVRLSKEFIALSLSRLSTFVNPLFSARHRSSFNLEVTLPKWDD